MEAVAGDAQSHRLLAPNSGKILARVQQSLSRHVRVCGDLQVGLSRSGLNAHLDRKTRFIKILAFKTAKVKRMAGTTVLEPAASAVTGHQRRVSYWILTVLTARSRSSKEVFDPG